VKARTHEILKTQKTTIFALSRLAEVRDPETGEHLERIRNFSVLIAQILKYSGNELEITNQYLRDLTIRPFFTTSERSAYPTTSY
jgi:putative two-component system response regulator